LEKSNYDPSMLTERSSSDTPLSLWLADTKKQNKNV